MNIDIHDELQVSRFGNGIKLSRPKNSSFQNTVSNIFNLPFPVYLNSVDHRIIKINDIGADLNGFISLQDAINKKWYTTYKKNTFIDLMNGQNDVLINNKFIIIEDTVIRCDEIKINALSFKWPWYNKENKIIGLLGCSIWLNLHSIAKSLSLIRELGFLNVQEENQNFEIPLCKDVPNLHAEKFSSREKECLKYLLAGKTIKETAKLLHLSPRTVEEYLKRLKQKTGCRYKRELISLL